MSKKIALNFIYLLVFAICLLVFLSSCQKMDMTNTNLKVVERFFKVPADANPILIRIINNLKENEFNKPFISNFVKSEGFPIWEHAKITIKKKVKSRDGNPDTLVIIPIIPDNGLYVKDILAVKITTELLYKLYEREAYASYGFDKDSNRISPNADDVVNQIIQLEKEIFSAEAFVIKDNRLFDYWPSTLVKPESFFIKASIAIQQVPTYNGGGDGPCTTYAVYWQGHLAYYLTTGLCNNEGIPSGGGAGGGLDGGPGWTDSPPTSGGGGSTSPVPPCGSGFERVVINPDGLYSGPCTPPTQVPPDELPSILNDGPCDYYIKSLQTDPNFIEKMVELSNNSVMNLSYEIGYIVQNRLRNEYTFKTGFGNANGGGIIWENLLNINGTIHAHYKWLGEMFSPQDIISIAQSFIRGESSDPSNLFVAVATNFGPYLVKISDTANFRRFANKIYGTDKKKSDFIKDYYDNFRFINDNVANEKGFLNMLNDFSAEGSITLYRGNSDCNKWTALELTRHSVGPDTIEEQICN